MDDRDEDRTVKFLEPFVGEWGVEVTFPGQPPASSGARTTFEFMPGERFLVQRWGVPIPEAPDGIAIIGIAEETNTLLQHYFDTRGVARVYEMSFADGIWKLSRDTADFSPLGFSQRFEGAFSEDGHKIEGAWEICHDGAAWEHDFAMTYRKA